jgi:glycerol-3-phosphate dehydrogenase
MSAQRLCEGTSEHPGTPARGAEVDVVVIGTGFGGATVAARLLSTPT